MMLLEEGSLLAIVEAFWNDLHRNTNARQRHSENIQRPATCKMSSLTDPNHSYPIIDQSRCTQCYAMSNGHWRASLTWKRQL